MLEAIPEGPLIFLVDSYVHVFFTPSQLARFREIVDAFGRRRDLDWVSTDPLVPMGPSATSTVTGVRRRRRCSSATGAAACSGPSAGSRIAAGR